MVEVGRLVVLAKLNWIPLSKVQKAESPTPSFDGTHGTLIFRLFKDSDESLETVHSYAKPLWKSIMGWWRSNSLEMDVISVAGRCCICPYISRSVRAKIAYQFLKFAILNPFFPSTL